MARRGEKAQPVVQDGLEVEDSAGREHPAELRGEDSAGNVRPADNRYLTQEQIERRDAYVEEKTGDEAQQLLVKREAPEHVEALNERGRSD